MPQAVERRRWPATLSIAATFSPELALEWGTAMGDEFWGKGTNIQEGPGVRRGPAPGGFKLKVVSSYCQV